MTRGFFPSLIVGNAIGFAIILLIIAMIRSVKYLKTFYKGDKMRRVLWIVPSSEAKAKLEKEFRYKAMQQIADCQIEVLSFPRRGGKRAEYIIIDEVRPLSKGEKDV